MVKKHLSSVIALHEYLAFELSKAYSLKDSAIIISMVFIIKKIINLMVFQIMGDLFKFTCIFIYTYQYYVLYVCIFYFLVFIKQSFLQRNPMLHRYVCTHDARGCACMYLSWSNNGYPASTLGVPRISPNYFHCYSTIWFIIRYSEQSVFKPFPPVNFCLSL